MQLFLLSVLIIQEVSCCGYKSCTQAKEGIMNVHIVPHSHNDLGWIKTVDQYYKVQVCYILDSVIKELWRDPKRRFMYVETAFFWRWWGEKDREVKNQVKKLVDEGRLKFVGGAWAMNDEATTHYQSIIDQFTWGLKKLNETFGPCATPKVAWQIDTFGHSREFASLLAAMGYDGVFLCRIDPEEYDKRKKNKTMEFIWRGDDNLGSSSDIFTGILYGNHYLSPPGFKFESPYLFNLEKKNIIKAFYEDIKRLMKTYTTNNILIAIGEDFAYRNADIAFKNLDVIIESLNKKSAEENLNLTVFYSTPDCYLKAVKNANPILTLKRDDFFPYFNVKGYWTGYYTSRPSLKYFERDANRYLQMVKQLYVIAGLDRDGENFIIDELKSAMATLQHHDAITGTEKQHVAEDYKQILSQAVQNSLLVADKAFSKFAGGHNDDMFYKFDKCQLNQSECVTSETNQNFIVTVYNSLAWELFDVDVIIPVQQAKYIVIDSNGKKVNTRLITISKWYQTNILTRRSNATHELTFKAESLKALGFQSFYIKKLENFSITDINITDDSSKFDIEKEILEYGTSLISKIEGGYYPSTIRSGAYLFSPDTSEPELWYNFNLTEYKTMNDIRSNVNAIIKQFKKKRNLVLLQIAWLCNSIPVEDYVGKEVVVRYNTYLENNGVFYTDSNGRQMIKRRLVKGNKPFYLLDEHHVAGNYYPVPSKIFITDNEKKFTIITDRAEGGYSPKDGTIELMINRRLLHDDYLGVDEALNDDGSVNIVNHFVIISNVSDRESILDEKRVNFEVNMAPITLFSDAKDLSLHKWLKLNHSTVGLIRDLPEGLHLLTLEPWSKWQLLLRLENYLEESDRNYTIIDINLRDIFSTVTLKSIKETTLAANQWLNDENEKWNDNNIRDFLDNHGNFSKQERMRIIYGTKSAKIKLYSKQIRTFIVDYEMKLEV